jgi:hypothetical protein
MPEHTEKIMRLTIGAVVLLFALAIQPAAAQEGGWVTGEVAAKEANGKRAGDPAYEAFDRGKYDEARELAEKQAANGVAASNTLLGMLYERGLGVKIDAAQAAVHYANGAQLGEQHAQFALGLVLAEGRGIKQNKKQAIQFFELSAAQGNANAMYNLALMYVDGNGVEQNYSKAAEWLEGAAKRDHAPAQYDLAALYKEGVGVKQSVTTAAHWLQKAAEAGMTNAELEFGIALFLGKGVKKDEKLGFQMFRRSAEKGNPVAQNRLAHAYAAGLGTEHDPVEAAKWHMLSREFGVSDFRLDQFLSGLSQDVRSKAQQSAELWQKSTDALLQ